MPWSLPLVRGGALVLVACLLGVARPVVHAQPSTSQVKAAFLTKFPEYVQWPADSRTSRVTFDLCLSADRSFQRLVEDMAAGSRVNGREMRVREIARSEPLNDCAVLYVGRESDSLGLLERAASLPILTVSDAGDALVRGGIIRLREVDQRVRFDVQRANAERVGLQLSGQLMRLALTVRGTP